ncbi:hypothetical protein GHT09_009160 [Marmota monax]|uniref:Uncharacterized protein n=1 Tax=Marmota monax TaxID=9995 RepID=A0A834PQF4_MARMO|nr:hypothetical protein GHT09_009160 [Marmota monax]
MVLKSLTDFKGQLTVARPTLGTGTRRPRTPWAATSVSPLLSSVSQWTSGRKPPLGVGDKKVNFCLREPPTPTGRPVGLGHPGPHQPELWPPPSPVPRGCGLTPWADLGTRAEAGHSPDGLFPGSPLRGPGHPPRVPSSLPARAPGLRVSPSLPWTLAPDRSPQFFQFCPSRGILAPCHLQSPVPSRPPPWGTPGSWAVTQLPGCPGPRWPCGRASRATPAL